jgi:hypothetical protein
MTAILTLASLDSDEESVALAAARADCGDADAAATFT